MRLSGKYYPVWACLGKVNLPSAATKDSDDSEGTGWQGHIAKDGSEVMFVLLKEVYYRFFDILGERIDVLMLIKLLFLWEVNGVHSEHVGIFDVKHVAGVVICLMVKVADLKVGSIVSTQVLNKHDFVNIKTGPDVVLEAAKERRLVTQLNPVEFVPDANTCFSDANDAIVVKVSWVLELDYVEIIFEFDVN